MYQRFFVFFLVEGGGGGGAIVQCLSKFQLFSSSHNQPVMTLLGAQGDRVEQ